jgi:hypothetical protein
MSITTFITLFKVRRIAKLSLTRDRIHDNCNGCGSRCICEHARELDIEYCVQFARGDTGTGDRTLPARHRLQMVDVGIGVVVSSSVGMASQAFAPFACVQLRLECGKSASGLRLCVCKCRCGRTLYRALTTAEWEREGSERSDSCLSLSEAETQNRRCCYGCCRVLLPKKSTPAAQAFVILLHHCVRGGGVTQMGVVWEVEEVGRVGYGSARCG